MEYLTQNVYKMKIVMEVSWGAGGLFNAADSTCERTVYVYREGKGMTE